MTDAFCCCLSVENQDQHSCECSGQHYHISLTQAYHLGRIYAREGKFISIGSYALYRKGDVQLADKNHWVKWIASGTQICGESLPGIPVVEIAGDRRVLIERHEGVIEYGTELIRIRVQYGVVCIGGCDLQLKQMTKQQLVVSGRIDTIQIQRRCG